MRLVNSSMSNIYEGDDNETMTKKPHKNYMIIWLEIRKVFTTHAIANTINH